MNKEEVAANRRKWLEALRSGKYRQTISRLRYGVSFCCLGVACDISGLGEWTDDSAYAVFGRFNLGTLAGAMAEWIGFEIEGFQNDLITLNDQEGASFEKIANYAERTFNSLPHFGDPI